MLRPLFLFLIGVLFTVVVVHVQAEEVDLALNKPTTSSRFSGTSSPHNAVDGRRDTIFHSASFDAYLQVDLLANATITDIYIINREDCCQDRLVGAIVYILDYFGNVVGHDTIDNVLSSATVSIDFTGVARFIKITHNTNFLNIAGIVVRGTSDSKGLTDIALHRPSSSSGHEAAFIDSYAVDGDEITMYHSTGINPWWSVNLQAIYDVRQVTILNRHDCCQYRLQDAIVEVLDVESNVVASQTISISSVNVNAAFVTFPPDTIGHHIRIVHRGAKILHFTQVDVYGHADAVTGLVGNLALNRPVHFSNEKGDFRASNLVDGAFDNGSSGMYESGRNVNNFVEITLDSTAIIHRINIFNRNDCCWDRLYGAYVQLLDYQKNPVSFRYGGPGEPITRRVTIEQNDDRDMIPIFLPNVMASFVRITLDHNTLNLREVEVFGHLSTYGMSNLALGKQSWQHMNNIPREANPDLHRSDKALDGSLLTYTHSGIAVGNWWMVNLGAEASVRQIKIIGRQQTKALLQGIKIELISTSYGRTGVVKTLLAPPSEIVELNFQDSVARYIKFTSENDSMQLAEVEVYGMWNTDGMTNLALGKPAVQSTTLGSFVASNVVDGNVNTFSHTTRVSGNVWRVDLGAEFNIVRVNVINRQEEVSMGRLIGAYVEILGADMTTVVHPPTHEALEVTELSSLGASFSFTNPARGRGVQITLRGSILNLAQVEVFGYPV